jgi:hypothetical protein
MATQQQLVDLFGIQNITCLDHSERELFASAGIEATELFEVGLPDRLSGAFSLEVLADPEAFDGVPAALNGTRVTLVTLGAPHSDSSLRYFLNPGNGCVILGELGEDVPKAETVNKSLGIFIEFLYRIGRYKAFRNGVDEDQRADYKDLLIAYLSALDAESLRTPENWWSLVVDKL